MVQTTHTTPRSCVPRARLVIKLGGIMGALFLTTACSSLMNITSTASTPPADLQFNPAHHETQQLTVSGQALAVRAFEGIVYVAQPVDSTYQVMNIYVPEAYFQGQTLNGYTAQTAPIFLPNQVGGYMPALPGTARAPAQGPGAGRTSAIAQALAQGFVVASPGARGRTTQDAQGRYTGKAPAAIVDLKAAVRYLRFNDAAMPGNAERIVSNGTSAGGALSALLGASGNHPDYEAELQALGAAPARDDIFAVSAYCPITNLDHADAAYEWQFNGINDFRKIDISMLDFKVQRTEVAGTLTPEQVQVSNELKASFPAYVNSLHLRSPQGQPLTLDDAGQGSFKDAVAALVMASAQAALADGQDLSHLNWLHIQAGRVTSLDYDAYLRYAGRMKQPPAFDDLGLASGENELFGTTTDKARHFTAFSAQHNTATGASQASAQVVKMMNAMAYIGAPGATNATHWRIRHGTKDRDTSLAIPAMLATTLQSQGYAVDFALPWDRPHSGDYDLKELFAWIALVARAGP
jgi:hypothetical protein